MSLLVRARSQTYDQGPNAYKMSDEDMMNQVVRDSRDSLTMSP